MATIHFPKEFGIRFVEIYEDCIFRPNDSVKNTPNVFNAKHGALGIDIFFDMDFPPQSNIQICSTVSSK